MSRIGHRTYSQAKICYQKEYVEKYHPGTRDNPGYVTSREDKVARPCPKIRIFTARTVIGIGREILRMTTMHIQRRHQALALWPVDQPHRTAILAWKEAWLAVFLEVL